MGGASTVTKYGGPPHPDRNVYLPLTLLNGILRNLLQSKMINSKVWSAVCAVTDSFLTVRTSLQRELPIGFFSAADDARLNNGRGMSCLLSLYDEAISPLVAQMTVGSFDNDQEAALSALAKIFVFFERLAPTVIDKNIQSILLIAARPCGTVDESPLVAFLSLAVERLGTANLLVPFLRELKRCGLAHGEDTRTGNVAIHLLLKNRLFASAITKAVSVSMDVEEILSFVVEATMDVTVRAAEAPPASSDDVVYSILLLCRHVLRGVIPVGVVSTLIIERLAEAELTFTAFVTQLNTMATTDESASPLTQEQSSLVAAVLRQLHAFRSVTALCLQEVGMDKCLEFFTMMEQTLWHFSSEVGHIIGDLPLSTLDAFLPLCASEASEDSTQVDPGACALAQLTLQRLVMGTQVTKLLGQLLEPQKEARKSAKYVVKQLRTTLGGCLPNDDGAIFSCDGLCAAEWEVLFALHPDETAKLVEEYLSRGGPSSRGLDCLCSTAVGAFLLHCEGTGTSELPCPPAMPVLVHFLHQTLTKRGSIPRLAEVTEAACKLCRDQTTSQEVLDATRDFTTDLLMLGMECVGSQRRFHLPSCVTEESWFELIVPPAAVGCSAAKLSSALLRVLHRNRHIGASEQAVASNPCLHRSSSASQRGRRCGSVVGFCADCGGGAVGPIIQGGCPSWR